MHGLIHHTREDGTPYPADSCPIHGTLNNGEPAARSDEMFWRRDGTSFPVEYRVHPLRLEDRIIGVVCTFSDITERRRTEAGMKLYSKVFESTHEAIMVMGADKRLALINQAFSEITGYSRDDVLGRSLNLMGSGRHDKTFYKAIWRSLDEQGQWQGEIWNRRKSGEIFPAWLTFSAVSDEFGKITNYVGVFSDITAIKEDAERLEYLAHHNPLTGLPNRLLFHARLTHSVQNAARGDEKLAVMFIDLDRFKQINDDYGHDVGDELLKQYAQRILKRVRAGDTVAHLSGDEFCIVMEAPRSADDATLLAQSLLDSMKESFDLGEHQATLSASIGISLFPDDSTEEEMLVRKADAAMYEAKKQGRNAYILSSNGNSARD